MDDLEPLGAAGASIASTSAKLTELNRQAKRFGATITGAFAAGAAQGKSFEDVLGKVGQKFIDIGLKAALKPVQAGMGVLFSQLFGGLQGGLGSLLGGGGRGAPVTPFADGGVISAPGYFPLGRGLGLAGEAGPEAILPLRRGSDGSLGVAASGAGRAQNITVNIQTPDVAGFARSEAQVTAAIARAVARGRRGT
jgi:phage-related minor tail protein